MSFGMDEKTTESNVFLSKINRQCIGLNHLPSFVRFVYYETRGFEAQMRCSRCNELYEQALTDSERLAFAREVHAITMPFER